MSEVVENVPGDGATQQDDGEAAGELGQAAEQPAVVATATLSASVPEVAALQNKITALQEELDSSSRFAEKREQQLVQLHTELERFKKGEPENKLRAVLIDLIALHDDVQDIITKNDLAEDSAMKRSLTAFGAGIIETLKRNGIEPYWVDGDAFDRERQRPLQAVATTDPARDMTIARRVRIGFRSADRTIRQEVVDVYRLTQ